MKLKLSAEPFASCYGLMITDEDYLIEIDESKIPKEILERLGQWYSKYSKYINKTLEYLSSVYESEIFPLDKEGIEIVNEIYKRNLFLGIDRYIYWSRGKDEVLLEIDKNDSQDKLNKLISKNIYPSPSDT